MGQVTCTFRSFDSTPALKQHASALVSSLHELLPESAHFRWTFGYEKSKQITFAELELHGTHGLDAMICEVDTNLYTAMSRAVRKLEQIILDNNHKRLDRQRRRVSR